MCTRALVRRSTAPPSFRRLRDRRMDRSDEDEEGEQRDLDGRRWLEGRLTIALIWSKFKDLVSIS